MITVIATGFDGRRRPAADRAQQPERVPAGALRSAPAAAGAAGASVPARDFLEELERQRTEVEPDGLEANGQAAATAPARSVGEPAPAKRPASLRRRRPRDPVLPPPPLAGAAGRHAAVTARPFEDPAPMSADEVASLAAARDRVLERIDRAAARAGRDPAARDPGRRLEDRARRPASRRRSRPGSRRWARTASRRRPTRSPATRGGTWHLIGPLQSNKAGRAVELFDAVQSVDGLAHRAATRPPRRPSADPAARCRCCSR